LICYAFNFSPQCDDIYSLKQGKFHADGRFARYMEFFVTPGSVLSGCFSMHFIVTLAGQKNIVRYSGKLVTKRLYRGSTEINSSHGTKQVRFCPGAGENT